MVRDAVRRFIGNGLHVGVWKTLAQACAGARDCSRPWVQRRVFDGPPREAEPHALEAERLIRKLRDNPTVAAVNVVYWDEVVSMRCESEIDQQVRGPERVLSSGPG